MVMDKKRKCSKCKLTLNLSDFPGRNDGSKLKRYYCKKCYRKYIREWWAKNSGERKRYARKWYANNREKIIKQKVRSNLQIRRLSRLDCIEH